MSGAVAPDVMTSAITRLFDDLNAERMDGVGALFTADATLRAPRIGTVAGREAVLAFFASAFRPFVTHVEAPTRILISGATATVEMHFDGTTVGGGALAFDGVDIVDFDEAGLITALSSWNDSATIGKQLRALLSSGERSPA